MVEFDAANGDRYVDKSAWALGPWQDEPDRVEWRYRGMPCLIVRGGGGAPGGYVGLPPGHPGHGKDYDEDPNWDYRCHGGLTFASACQEGGKICHVPAPGEPADVWWLGFDCSHSGDLRPGDTQYANGPHGHLFRGDPGEVERLADQVIATSAP